jgi:hypothetical protein
VRASSHGRAIYYTPGPGSAFEIDATLANGMRIHSSASLIDLPRYGLIGALLLKGAMIEQLVIAVLRGPPRATGSASQHVAPICHTRNQKAVCDSTKICAIVLFRGQTAVRVGGSDKI